jgi:tetratricopeptide (TPR) repeat protein
MTLAKPFKKITLLIVLFCCFAAISFAQQNPQALFDRANEEMNSGNYQQAISLYNDLEEQKTISGALFLNMGISYQRIDSLGKAKYYFLKASRFEETSDKARQALEFVESQFSRQSAVLPKLPWDVATDWLQNNIGATNLLITGIIILNTGVMVFIAHWFLQWYPNYIRMVGLTILGIALLVLATSFYTHYVNQRYSTAVMVTPKKPVLEQPREEASLVSQAFEGYTFTVDHYRSDSQPGWSYVRMSNGLYGWIPNSEILIL